VIIDLNWNWFRFHSKHHFLCIVVLRMWTLHEFHPDTESILNTQAYTLLQTALGRTNKYLLCCISNIFIWVPTKPQAHSFADLVTILKAHFNQTNHQTVPFPLLQPTWQWSYCSSQGGGILTHCKLRGQLLEWCPNPGNNANSISESFPLHSWAPWIEGGTFP